MESVVFFGKGGIGKSTIASNLTVILSVGGRKVLHVGCDPKTDSTLSLMRRHIPPFTALPGRDAEASLRGSIYPSEVKGVHCLEAGGPQPGMGCAGTGIGSMLDAMKDGEVLEKDGYDAAVFDVLGDVVCGGFAAPLRRGFAKKAVIVTSEETLSLFAANRLIAMIGNYSRNGVYLAGLVVNARNQEGVRAAEDFARAAGTRVLGVILQDKAVAASEREHRPAVLAHPKSDFTRRIARLCAALKAAGPQKEPPRAMSDAEFFDFAEGREVSRSAKHGASAKAAPEGSAASIFAAAGFTVLGMEHGQMICGWNSSKGTFRTVIAHATAAHKGITRFSDWGICFHSSCGGDTGSLGGELAAAAGRLAGLKFDELLAAFAGGKDLYSGRKAILNIPEDPASQEHYSFNQPHVGFHHDRFIFPSPVPDAGTAPGAVLVEYGDSECRFCSCEGGALGPFSEEPGLRGGGARSGVPALPGAAGNIISADFNGKDAAGGDEGKVLEAVNKAADRAGRGGLVEFYTACSPMLLSRAPGDLARQAAGGKGVKLVLENHNNFSEYGAAKVAARVDFVARKLLPRGAKKTRDVNLVNFGAAAGELAGLLAENGISSVAPGEEFYAGARSARLQVLPGPDVVLVPAFAKAGMASLVPPAPFGFAGTEAWLAAIAAALDRKKLSGPSASQKERALELRRRLAGFAAGFAVEAGEIGLLAASSAFGSVPVLPVLAEAGLKLRLFIKSDGPVKKTSAELAALKTSLPGRGLSFEFFKTSAELRKLLRADKALRLVYSQVRRDSRLLAAGKNPFSAELFKPGYEGALETALRLAELCEWDYNERYFLQK